jgi:hypothetical protein
MLYREELLFWNAYETKKKNLEKIHSFSLNLMELRYPLGLFQYTVLVVTGLVIQWRWILNSNGKVLNVRYP